MTALARTTDPDTSHAAAVCVSFVLNELEEQVLDILSCMGEDGGTTVEIALLAEVGRDSISPRMKPLELKGKVKRTNVRRDGRIVWTAL